MHLDKFTLEIQLTTKRSTNLAMIEIVYNYYSLSGFSSCPSTSDTINDSIIAYWLPETHMQNTLEVTILVK